MSESRRDDAEAFYQFVSWPKWATVRCEPDDGRRGSIVRRARMWVDRERRPPMVRWDGRVDTEEIDWWRLRRV